MERSEIIDGVVDLLRLHNDGLRGTIHQEPYKGDFFKLFAAAFNAGLIESPAAKAGYLSADALASALGDRAPEIPTNQTYYDLLTFWKEWTYAWHRCADLKR